MYANIQVLAVTLKELRELLRRPLLILTLILGPVAIMVIFGLGSNATPQPPEAIIVVPPGQEKPRLLQDYQNQFEQFLVVTEYTDDEEYARGQLARNNVDAVVVLPLTPFERVAGGRQATILVLYNEIDPLWRTLVPDFVRALAGEINRQIFLQNAGEQQASLDDALVDIDLALDALDEAIAAADRGDRGEVRRQVQEARSRTAEVEDALETLGPEGEPLRSVVEQSRARLEEDDRQLAGQEPRVGTPEPKPLNEQLGLAQTRRNVQRLRDTIADLTSVPPEVVIAPLAVEARYVARLSPDIITFFAPTILALLIQHIAVSLGALALVSERLAGTFQLYMAAPLSNLQLLLGKYLAYVFFTLLIAAALLALLLGPLGVPLFGSVFRLFLTVFLLSVSSVGLGFAFSLIASSDRQAVQLSMLALLGVVFFSGIALPLEALTQPTLTFSYALPATYGVGLLQDVMLRGQPGDNRSLLALAAIAGALFLGCWLLLRWRTSAR